MISPDDKIATVSKGDNVLAYPLSPYLITGICAFCAAASKTHMRSFAHLFLVLGLGLLLTDFSLKFLFYTERSPLKKTSYVFRYLGLFLVCVFYFYSRTEPNPYPNLAPRQTELELRVEDVSRGSGALLYGMARIKRAPPDLPKLEGMRIWFSVFADAVNLLPSASPSDIFNMRGILSRTGMEYPAGRFNGNEDGFDSYLEGRMIFFKFIAKIPNISTVNKRGVFRSFVESSREYMLRSLSKLSFGISTESEGARTYRAMMLGDKSLISSDQKRNFRDTGTMHVFAVSGLHVGFAAAALFAGLSFLGVNWRFQSIFTLPFLLLYVFACGAKPSSVRAFAMIAIVYLTSSIGRGSSAFAALILSATVFLLVDPLELFDAGFTLSYAIVVSIFVFGLPLCRCVRPILRSIIPSRGRSVLSVFRYLLDWTVCALCISLGAMLASFPLGAYYFSSISPMSIFYSPIFVSAAGFVVALGFAGFFLPSFATCALNSTAVVIVNAMNFCASFASENNLARGVDFQTPSSISTAIAIGVFLCIPSIFSNRGFFLHFCLAPIAMFSILVFPRIYV